MLKKWPVSAHFSNLSSKSFLKFWGISRISGIRFLWNLFPNYHSHANRLHMDFVLAFRSDFQYWGDSACRSLPSEPRWAVFESHDQDEGLSSAFSLSMSCHDSGLTRFEADESDHDGQIR
jgi:hypothetical protein